ncbi:MAG: hypothetical protein ABJB16_16470 [Saprospiraceae bacterium]
MDEKTFLETERILIKVGKNRNRYINDAVSFYNILQKRKLLSIQFVKESKLVREESMKILAEFEMLQEGD